MKDFRITWIEKVGYKTLVEAKTKQEAIDKFIKGDYTCENKVLGGEIMAGTVEADCSSCESEPCICDDKLKGKENKE